MPALVARSLRTTLREFKQFMGSPNPTRRFCSGSACWGWHGENVGVVECVARDSVDRGGDYQLVGAVGQVIGNAEGASPGGLRRSSAAAREGAKIHVRIQFHLVAEIPLHRETGRSQHVGHELTIRDLLTSLPVEDSLQ